jgi:putative oxidoreductase
MKKLTSAILDNTGGHNKAFVFLRMALGILLFTKGIDFIDTVLPIEQLRQPDETISISSVYAATGWAQLAGSIFIILGLFTRTACCVQLLIVTMALLIKFSNYTLSDGGLLEIIIIISGLILFLLKGGGSISLDRFFRLYKSEHLVFWA